MNCKVLTKLASASVLVLSLGLAGCATKLNLEAPYDEMTFEKALPESDPPAPVQVVETPKVLPLPGQLKPFPEAAKWRPARQEVVVRGDTDVVVKLKPASQN